MKPVLQVSCLVLQIFLAGCTNSPGALELTLVVEQEGFAPGNPIRLAVSLTATEGPVCLVKSYRFVAEVSRRGTYAAPMNTDETVGWCGTGRVECLLLSPVLLPIMLGDVADAMGRHTVINKGEHKGHALEVFMGQHDGRKYCTLWRPPMRNAQAWPPGEYLVKVRLDNKAHSALGIFPPPLFWWRYSQPVEGEIIIRVRDDSQ